MAMQFSKETMLSLAKTFKESHKGYWLLTMYKESECSCEICYNVDPCFFETVSESSFRTFEELTRWLSEKSALCTNERLLKAYERQLERIRTGDTAHDFNGNIFEEGLRTQWLNEQIAKLKGE